MNVPDDALLQALDRAVVKKAQERQPAQGEQVITGKYGTQDYAAVRACQRKNLKLMFQGVLYRVIWVQIADGRFRAGVRKCRSQ